MIFLHRFLYKLVKLVQDINRLSFKNTCFNPGKAAQSKQGSRRFIPRERKVISEHIVKLD